MSSSESDSSISPGYPLLSSSPLPRNRPTRTIKHTHKMAQLASNMAHKEGKERKGEKGDHGGLKKTQMMCDDAALRRERLQGAIEKRGREDDEDEDSRDKRHRRMTNEEESSLLKKMRQMEKKLNSVEEKLDLLLERMEARGVAEPPGTKKEDDEPFQVGSDAHLLHLPAANPYSWALSAVSILFTKEELHTSLLFSSKKSKKPGLDRKRVEKLLTLMGRKFKDGDWDIKTLTLKINQKCRDIKL